MKGLLTLDTDTNVTEAEDGADSCAPDSKMQQDTRRAHLINLLKLADSLHKLPTSPLIMLPLSQVLFQEGNGQEAVIALQRVCVQVRVAVPLH